MLLPANMDQMGGLPAVCPRCGRIVPLHGGRPLINATAIELWHDSCWDVHNEDADITVVETHPRGDHEARTRRTLRRVSLMTVGAAAVGVACWLGLKPPTASLASIDVGSAESFSFHAQAIEHEVPPPALDPFTRHRIPKQHGIPIDEMYPSLLDWKHPVVKTDLMLPLLPTGEFGAERDGVKRRECGRGHCGSDIGGPVGRPIVAVAAGVVLHVDRARRGKDGRSGRYVRLEHDDGTVTAYMHLNSVTAGLDVGDHVRAGQQIGTLGSTGVRRANPHLHFALELPNVPGTKGANKNTHYVNPQAFLVRAQVIDAPDRRRSRKPST